MDHGNSPTLQSGGATLRAAVAELEGPQLENLVRLDRYEAGSLIGKGGMGEVRQCRDVRLDRHIALKTATTKNKAELNRFIREAQVQGQLEHPSIVPVYELGVGADGAPYFAMKRVRGESIFDVLTRLQGKEPEALAKYPRRKLLTAFLSVCQAVDYAHTNGWLHRDLKPANIMLGDFGEVYVLDWGLARRLDERDEEEVSNGGTLHLEPVGLTTPGSLMGTPGYMSPEQVAGQRADTKSDIYALGAILFEVLTHQMLAKGATTMELLVNTREGCDARARQRAPHAEVPPELEQICVKATARDPRERYVSVRELHDAVDRVLAGERDHELRSDLARQHAEAARTADTLAQTEPAHELEHRKTALREVGLSLALDPTHRPAMKQLLALMKSVPHETPPEVQGEIAQSEAEGIRMASRFSTAAYLFAFALTGSMLFMAFNGYVIASAGLFLLAALSTAWLGWRVRRPTARSMVPMMFITNLAIMSVFFTEGPLTILPVLATANALALRVAASNKYKRLILVMGLVTVLLPLFGSMFGLLPESLRFVSEGLLLVPVGFEYSMRHTPLMLLAGYIGVIVAASIVIGRTRDTAARLERERALHAWNLAQLLPPEASPQSGPQADSMGPSCPVGKVAQALHGTR